MAKSPADLVAGLIVTRGLGVNPPGTAGQWVVRVGRQGDMPHQHITTYDTGGQADNPKWRINYPSIQVRVRGNKDQYDVAWAKMNDIKEYLVGIEPVTVGDMHISGLIAIGGPAFIGYDGESRPEFTFNMRGFIEPEADSSPQMHRESL